MLSSKLRVGLVESFPTLLLIAPCGSRRMRALRLQLRSTDQNLGGVLADVLLLISSSVTAGGQGREPPLQIPEMPSHFSVVEGAGHQESLRGRDAVCRF